jgi:hypothetical protein
MERPSFIDLANMFNVKANRVCPFVEPSVRRGADAVADKCGENRGKRKALVIWARASRQGSHGVRRNARE